LELNKAIDEAKQKSKKRKFTQSIDLAIRLKNIDLKKQESKFSEEVVLPHGRGRDFEIAIFAEGELAEKAKKAQLTLFTPADIEVFGKDKRKTRKAVRQYEYFLSQPNFMAQIGKSMGAVMGPKGKMPKPIPPQADPKPFAERLKRSVRVKVRDQPVIHTPIGTEDMGTDQLKANANAILTVLKRRLPKGDDNIAHIFVKTTMGPAVKIE